MSAPLLRVKRLIEPCDDLDDDDQIRLFPRTPMTRRAYGEQMIELVATGLIYRNPKPFLKSVHAWHPMESGDLVVSYDLAEAVSSTDYGSYHARSSDGGVTWTEPVRFFADADDESRTHAVRISRLGDGTLVGAGHWRFNDHPDQPGWNPETYGVDRGGWFFTRSPDGEHWDDPEAVTTPFSDQPFEMCHATVEARDGRLLMPTGLLRTWDGEAPNGLRTIALVSDDRARTWRDHLELFVDPDGEIIYHEVSLIQLPDGRLLTVAWPFNATAGKTLIPVPFAISSGGEHFDVRGSTGIPGETTKLLSLGDDRVLCLMRRTDQAGLWAVVAQIRGNEWVNLEEAPMWQGSESRMLGERDAATELSELAFGFPNLLLLPDRDVYAAFWCREQCIHNIRWLRIRIS